MAATNEKRTITEGERLQLVGLLTLMAQANRESDRIERAVAGVVGEPEDAGSYFGIASDICGEVGRQGEPTTAAADLLRRLEIEAVSDAG